MSEAARALVQRMIAAGAWPEPALLEEIMEQGQDVVEPLLEIVRSRPQGQSAEAVRHNAIFLLCALHPPEALPDLLALFNQQNHDLIETVSENAATFGPAVVAPALAIAADTSLPWYPRAAAAELALQAAGNDPHLRTQVATNLRELLAQQIARAPDYAEAEGEEVEDERAMSPGSLDDYLQLTTNLVCDLATLADPEARDLIKEAFSLDLVDRWMIDEITVALFYKEKRPQSDPPTPRAMLKAYRESYEEHRAMERRQPLDLLRTSPAPLLASAKETAPEKRSGSKDRAPGRNEPCWCGSGKKYKNCHMRSDRA